MKFMRWTRVNNLCIHHENRLDRVFPLADLTYTAPFQVKKYSNQPGTKKDGQVTPWDEWVHEGALQFDLDQITRQYAVVCLFISI